MIWAVLRHTVLSELKTEKYVEETKRHRPGIFKHSLKVL